MSPWNDCPTREDVLGEKALSEETSQKLSLQSAVLMPKIECKLEEVSHVTHASGSMCLAFSRPIRALYCTICIAAVHWR